MTPDVDDETGITPNSRTDTHESRNEPQIVDEYDPLHALRGLAPGARLTIHRQTPAYAKGFLDHLTVPESGEVDIESEIKTNWGGGTFKIQPRQLSPNGRMNFGKGCVILAIAGEPMLNGRRYVGGILEDPPAATAQQVQPYMMPNPASASPRGLEGQLLTMVQQTLARAGSPNGTGVDLAGLGTLITSMSGILGGNSGSGDAMNEVDRAFGLMTKMQKMFGLGGERSSRDDDDSSDSIFGGGALGQAIVAKLMGGSQPPAQTPYPPQYHPGYPPQQAPTQNYPYPPGQGYPPPPGNWPGQQPGVRYQEPQAPAYGTPPHQQAQQPRKQAEAGPSTDDGPYESEAPVEDDGPFTIDNLAAELEDMSEEQRTEFMAGLIEKFGLDASLGSMLQGAVEKQASGEPNGAAVFPTANFDPGSFDRDT